MSTKLGLLGTPLPHKYLGLLVRQKHVREKLDKKELKYSSQVVLANINNF